MAKIVSIFHESPYTRLIIVSCCHSGVVLLLCVLSSHSIQMWVHVMTVLYNNYNVYQGHSYCRAQRALCLLSVGWIVVYSLMYIYKFVHIIAWLTGEGA